jgi:single-strand DNA-binding protein
MNRIILIGNLTRDPEPGTTQSGVSFTRFTIAVNRTFANAAGERLADYFDVIAWRTVGELCAKHLYKGNKVGITGKDEVEFLTPKSANPRAGDEPPQDVVSELTPVDLPEDLPF